MRLEVMINAVADIVLALACFLISFCLMRSWAWLRRAKLPTSLYVMYAVFIGLLGLSCLLEIGVQILGLSPLFAILAKLAAAGTAGWTACVSLWFPEKVTPLAKVDMGTEQIRGRMLELRRMLDQV